MGICVSCRRRDRKAPEKRSGVGLGAGGPAKGPAAAELLPRRVHYLPAMANSISNIKMTNPIKGIVSKRRKRYIKDGFNLDLAYITDRLIAMGFPAEKLEGVYRNHIDEVYRFLEQMHKDHYKIYNLCSERSYDTSKFQGRVGVYAFEDHTPPNLELIQPFCEDVHKWLSEDPRNVAAVHCKAGKGRTGTMVCCYLLYSGQKATADEALQFYGSKRAHDEKGVTIPSQRRYVEYYAALMRSGLQYAHTAVYIRELVMCPPPMLNGGQCTLELTVSQAQPPFKAPHGCHEVRKHARSVRVCLTHCTPLQGDVRVDVYNKPKMMMRKEKLFHFWFNTFFLVCEVGAQRVPSPADSPNQETFKLTLNKWQLDDAHKDKQHKLYSPDFKVELIVQKQPESSTFSSRPARAPSPPSSSASDCSAPADEHWDSGERPLYPPTADNYITVDDPGRTRPPRDHYIEVDAPGETPRNYIAVDDPGRPPRDYITVDDPDRTRPPRDHYIAVDDTKTHPSREYSEDHMFFDFSINRSTKSTNVDLADTKPNVKHAADRSKSLKSKLDKAYRTYPVYDEPTLDQDSGSTDAGTKSDRKTKPDCQDMFLKADKTFSPNFKTDSKNYIKFTCIPPTSAVTECKYKPGDPYSLLPDVDSRNDAYLDLPVSRQFDKQNYGEQTQSIGQTMTETCCKSDKNTIKSDYTLLAPPDQSDNRTSSKPRLSLTDVRASWKEFSGKFSDNRKKRDKD